MPPIYQPLVYHPPGCICPPTSEKTCQADYCPRRGTKASAPPKGDPRCRCGLKPTQTCTNPNCYRNG